MIRHAAISDLPAIRGLITALGYDPPADLEVRFRQLTSPSDGILLVYEMEGTVVAFLSLHYIPQIALEGDFARISYFAVDDHVRGQGIGSQLVDHVTVLARGRNCDRIEVHCHSRRTDAHRFYEWHGYLESPKYFIKSLRD